MVKKEKAQEDKEKIKQKVKKKKRSKGLHGFSIVRGDKI